MYEGPSEAVRDSRVMITALTGSTTEPNSRNKAMSIPATTVTSIQGVRSAMAARKSSLPGAPPPTLSAIESVASSARTLRTSSAVRGSEVVNGETASMRTVAPRT
jgi:hypothetical protein